MSNLFKVSAPTRVDLAGGTNDIWPLYCLLSENAFTINLAINLCAHVVIEWESGHDFQLRMKSGSLLAELKAPLERGQLALLKPELQFPAYVAGEAFRMLPALPKARIQITVSSDVPPGSGLGGSSALCVAVARAVTRMTAQFSEQGWQWSMLPWVRDVEAKFLRAATGTQDYLASLFGGFSCFVSKTGAMERHAYSDEVTQELEDRMVVLFSGQVHQSGLSNFEIFRRALEGDKTIVQGLNGINEVAASLDRELRLSRRDWRAIGQVMNAEWKIRRELFRVNTPKLDEIIGLLQSQGVTGAKVCGAAAGGSVLAVVEPDSHASLVEACRKRGLQVLESLPSRSGVTIRG